MTVGSLAAAPVAGRPGIGARGIGPDLEQPERVDARDRAAAGADLDHLDHGQVDRQPGALLEAVAAVDLEAVRQQRLAPVDHRELGGGAAHIEGEEILVAGRGAEGRRGQRSPGGTALQQADREARGRLDRGQRAGGDQHQQRAAESRPRQPLLQIAQVALDPGLDVDIGHGRRGALVLADLRHHVGRDRDADIGRGAQHGLPRASLQLGVGEAVEEGDGDRLDPGRGQLARPAARRTPRPGRAPGASSRRRGCAPARRSAARAARADAASPVAGRRGRSDARGRSRANRGIPRWPAARSRAPLRSISALVTRVVPWMIWPRASIAAFADARVSSSPVSIATRGIIRRRQRLADDELAARIVIDDQIGEGAADVDTGTQRRDGRGVGESETSEEECRGFLHRHPHPDLALTSTLAPGSWEPAFFSILLPSCRLDFSPSLI